MNLAKILHKVGDFGYSHPWRVVGCWIAVLAVLVPLALHFAEPTSTSISIPGTKAQQTADRIKEVFPDSAGASGRIVFHASSEVGVESQKDAITKLVSEVSKIDGVSMAVNPFTAETFISADKKIAFSQVQLTKSTGSVDEKTFDEINKLVDSSRSRDLQVEMTSELVDSAPREIIGVGEVVGVVIALVVLVLLFGSLVAAGMPLLSSLVAIGATMAGLFALNDFIDISSTTPVLAVMLGLAVGIDYALFIINKHRSYALAGYSYKKAAARALGTAGNAVVFAAMTVIIALSALSVVKIPFITVMGLVGAASIAVAALAALSLTPAFLSLAGGRVFGKKKRREAELAQKKATQKHSGDIDHVAGRKWGKLVVGRPLPVLLLGIVILGLVALPVRDLTLGLPSDEYAAADSTQRKSYDLLTKGFGVGFNAPLTILVDNLPAVTQAEKDQTKKSISAMYKKQFDAMAKQQQASLQQKMNQASSEEERSAVALQITNAQKSGEERKKRLLSQIERQSAQFAAYNQISALNKNLNKLKNVEKANVVKVNTDGSTGIIQLIPKSAPHDSKTSQLISHLRDSDTQKKLHGNGKAKLSVTGTVALEEDINKKLGEAVPVYISVVVGLSLLLLMLAFRSILVPIKATLGFLLSLIATFGALVAVFQWGWFGLADAPGPIINFTPIIVTGILFGLAMDYEFFLVSGMHESFQRTKKAKEAVIYGLGMGGKVVMAAAIIMIGVFGGFIFNGDSTIQAIGFALAFGILVDAFIVRMSLVPAAMTLLGKSAWWLPSWLDSKLPHVSIEGEADSAARK